ncbi:MAG: ASCH domain-containing protein [Patescibacteria group bacterium]
MREGKHLHQLNFLPEHRRTFELIRFGEKRIETRAGSPAYQEIKPGDTIEFSCGGDKFQKEVAAVEHYADLAELFKAYEPAAINPDISSPAELAARYQSFPDYTARLAEYGILVFKLKSAEQYG